ncbi:uncharacterized protein [Primulina huaijiensis]|uniref:uncharacterized protein n=1 Tax=Primulina huaijiensis TaxID=1492673 RepID=UPI003CC760EE
MAMNTERSSKALHNFTMPGQLRWGNQRFLRCMKVNSDGQISTHHRFNTSAADSHYNQHHHHHRRSISVQNRRARIRSVNRRESSCHGSHKVCSTPPPPVDHGIAAIREKVLFDLQTAAVKMKDSIFKESLENGEVSYLVSPPPLAAAAEFHQGETHRPWSLRTRRAACKTTPSGGGVTGSVSGSGPSPGLEPTRPSAAVDNSSRLRSGGGMAEGVEKRGREKFSVALSKSEIEEDFMTMVYHRPPRRPKKRLKIIQKQLDMLFPGLWLTEITADMYKVTEPAP